MASKNYEIYNTRKQLISQVLVNFCAEWVAILAGNQFTSQVMSPELEASIKSAVEPFLARGDRLVPIFDGKARVRLHASVDEVVNPTKNIVGEIINLTSRSHWQNNEGALYQWASQRVTIKFVLSSDLSKVVSAQFLFQEI